jgi:hypothetical protein
MAREIIILAVGALFGLGTTITALVAPAYLPVPMSSIHWLFWGGIALCGLMIIDSGIMILWAGALRENWLPLCLINFGFICVVAGFTLHYSPLHGPLAKTSLSGVGIFAAIEIRDVAAVRRKYIFDIGTPEGAKASFYLSASDRFTFAVTDTRKEQYPLEMPIVGETLSVGMPAYLLLECGVSNARTIIHVVVNGVEVARRSLPFAIDFGSRNWKNITVGANSSGQSGGAFVLAEFGILKATLAPVDFARMKVYYRDKYDLKIS